MDREVGIALQKLRARVNALEIFMLRTIALSFKSDDPVKEATELFVAIDQEMERTTSSRVDPVKSDMIAAENQEAMQDLQALIMSALERRHRRPTSDP